MSSSLNTGVGTLLLQLLDVGQPLAVVRQLCGQALDTCGRLRVVRLQLLGLLLRLASDASSWLTL